MKSEDMRADCFNNDLNAGITVMKNKTSSVWAINPECDDWFTEDEYIGLDLEEKELFILLSLLYFLFLC